MLGRARRARAGCLALLLPFLAACGGGGRERPLEGSWFGPTFSGAVRRIVIDERGDVKQYYKDGTPTGLTGTIRHKEGFYYEVKLSDKATGAFLMGSTGRHAALFVSNDDSVALERDATGLDPAGYDLTDVAPGSWGGTTCFLSKAGVLLEHTPSSADIEADGAYLGSDGQLREFFSPSGEVLEVLDARVGMLGGLYADQYHPDEGYLTLLICPDKAFAVAFANWPPWDVASRWIGLWTPADAAP